MSGIYPGYTARMRYTRIWVGRTRSIWVGYMRRILRVGYTRSVGYTRIILYKWDIPGLYCMRWNYQEYITSRIYQELYVIIPRGRSLTWERQVMLVSASLHLNDSLSIAIITSTCVSLPPLSLSLTLPPLVTGLLVSGIRKPELGVRCEGLGTSSEW